MRPNFHYSREVNASYDHRLRILEIAGENFHKIWLIFLFFVLSLNLRINVFELVSCVELVLVLSATTIWSMPAERDFS